MNRTLTALVCFALVGCDGSAPPGGIAGAPTYYQDVKPLIEHKCAACHVEGGIAPFALDTYDQVVAQKTSIKIAVEKRVMPPWLAAPGCTDYQHDRSLTDDQIAVFTKWVEGGAQAGKESDYVAPQITPPPTLSRVDANLAMPVAYTPQVAPDEYRCFIIDWPATQDTFVTGLRVNPGNEAIVHHVIAFVAPPDQVAMFQKLDDDEAGPGYTCFGGPGGGGMQQQAQWLGAWAPGGVGADFLDGTGIKVLAGSKIVLQLHYNTSTAAAAPDRTSVDVKLDATVAKEALIQPWANIDWVTKGTMKIPAGEKDATHSWAFDPTPFMGLITDGKLENSQGFTIHGAALHMHTRGTKARFDIIRNDEPTPDDGVDDRTRECMLNIPRWDFHWQSAYSFQKPKRFNPGDELYLECHWDNSSTPHDVYWGEGTNDEMCLGTFYVTQ